MPIKKYMMNLDGVDRQVSVDKFSKYGAELYAEKFPGSTIRMRDEQDGDYDIPLGDYQRALDSGLRPFVTSFYKDEEEEITERSTFKPDSVAYMTPPAPSGKVPNLPENVVNVPETAKTGTDVSGNVPEKPQTGTESVVKGTDSVEKASEKVPFTADASVLEQPKDVAARESTFVAEIPTEREPDKPMPVEYNYKPEVQEHIARNIPGIFKSDGKSLMDKPLNVDASIKEADWEGKKYGARFEAAVNYYNSDTFEKRQKKEVGDHLKALSGDVSKSLEDAHTKIRGRAAQGGNAANALMGSATFNRDNAGERQEVGRLNAAKSLIEESENIVRESGLKDKSGFFGGLGRGFKDVAFDPETWTMGLAEMANGKYLYDAVEKADKGEKLTPSEEKLLDAAVTNMAVSAYYGSDVGMGYKAGEMTGASIPFMLEFAINPVTSAGSGIAKSILKYGMKKLGSGIAKTGVAKAGARLVGDAIAAAGVTATTGLGGVGSGVVDRMTGQVKFGIDRDGQLTYQGREGQQTFGKALAKSVATNVLERQSEMIFNAFKGAGGALWGAVADHLPDGVTDFMKMASRSKVGKFYHALKNNATLREVSERTQFHGLPEEYMEEVYNNFANVALGEMTLEQATDLQQNIEIMLGLAPTSVFFGVLGGASLAYEKAKNRQAMQNKDEAQQKLFEELKKDSAQDDGVLKDFVADVVADEQMEPEAKKDAMDTAARVAADNAVDDMTVESEVSEETSKEPVSGPVSATRIVSVAEGARLYAEHDPVKMRQAVVKQQVSRQRMSDALVNPEEVDALLEADDATREAFLSTLDANQRRLAEDYLAQTDLVDGMNDAMDAAHNPEVEAAQALTQKMTSPNGKVVVVALGKHGDQEHEYGVVVNGVDANGNPTSPEGQVIVVPVASSPWAPDYSSFDEGNALSMRIEDARGDVSMLEPDVVAEGMLGDYNADAALLEEPKVVAGQQVMLSDEEGNMESAQIVGQSADGNWLVMEEGMKEPTSVSPEELRQLMFNAERAPILAEYAEADRAYEREQREMQRQAERAEQKAREAEEAARIAEEMKKPINRLAKHPDGKPDYENSRPEDVREYLIESLGLEGAVKSIRSQRADLEKQVAEQEAKVETLVMESEQNDYLPDEAIVARGFIQQEQDKLSSMKKKLDFWKGVERMTAGPTEAEAQEAVTRSVAQQKAAKTKRETYKPSEEYRKMQQTMAGSEVALDVLNDLEPHTPEELAAQLISGGVRLMKTDETVGDTVLKGVQSMTGYGARDLQRLNFIFSTRANGGVSVGEFGEMLERAAEEAGVRFGGTTQEEGVNALLSLLGDVETMGDINRYVERNRMNQASRLFEEEQDAISEAMDAAAWEEYGMSYADYEKLQDAITDLVEIRQRFTQDFWESDVYNDFISNFAGNITDNGQKGNDYAGSGTGVAETGGNDGRGNDVASGGNQEPTSGVQPSVEVAAGRQPIAGSERTPTEIDTTNGVGNDSGVPDGQGNRGDEGRTEVTAEQIEQAKQLANEAIAEVSKEIQGRPVYVVGSLEDLSLYKERAGEEIFAKIEGGYNEPGALASYVYDLNEIFLWANKAAEYGASKQNLKASIYHENVHALLYGNRYTSEDFKAFADQIRKAFPDIAEYVEERYSSQPESIRDEEVVTRYVEDLVDSRLEGLMLSGEGRIEGDTDAIGEELNHVINLLKDRKYERQGRNGRRQTLSVGDRPENGPSAYRMQEDIQPEKQEPVQPVEEQGALGASEGTGMAGREGIYGSLPDNASAAEGSGTEVVPYSIEPAQYTTKKGKVLDMYLVKFDPERFKNFLSWDVVKKEASELRGWRDRKLGGYLMRSREDAERLAEFTMMRAETDASDFESLRKEIEQAREEVNTSPTEAQKPVFMPKEGDFLKNNIAGADAVAVVRGVNEDGYLVAYAPGMEEAEAGFFMGDRIVPHAEMEQIMRDGGYTPIKNTRSSGDSGTISKAKEYHGGDQVYSTKHNENKYILMASRGGAEVKYFFTDGTTAFANEVEDARPDVKTNNIKPTYDEQGRETIESQAGRSRSEAEDLASQTEPGSLEDAPSTGRGSGTGGNRPAEGGSGSGRPQAVNGYRIGEKVLYKGKEATIFDFENDGTPVLDTGMAPVIYEVGYWEDIQKLPATMEQINRMADAQKPKKKLERAEQRQKRNQPKRDKQKEQMADLFAQVDALEEKLVREEQEIDAQLALLGEYRAGPKAQVREDMHTGAAKTLEKAGRKFAKNLASRLGGHVDGKELNRGITNIASIGGDMVFRVWMDEANTQGVMLLINFDTAPDTEAFDKLVPKYGFWRMVSDKDISGVRNSNHYFDIDNVKELESGAFMTKVANDMLKEINKNVVSTEKSLNNDERRNGQTDSGTSGRNEGAGLDGRTEGNQAENPRVGTEPRQEAERTEPGRDGGSVYGRDVPDTNGSGSVSGRDGEQQPSVTSSIKRNANNWSYGDTHLELPSGEIGKLKGNIEAIRTLKELEASGQPATPEQKQALLKFVGWGGLSEALNSAEYEEWQNKIEIARRWGWSESGAATNWSKKWGKHYDELRSLMTEEEWAQAQASTLNSHYTPETVIRGLWEALEYMGFRGGKILEPAMGVGHILGFMPKGISERSTISGFELDGLPGRIAKQLYPDADITVAGYETAFRPGTKDAIVTNVPFGQTAPVDPALDKALRRKIGVAYNLHNYFIIKGLLELKPGGVGAFITSSATMDGRSTKAREYIAGLGVDLVGAIRLPNNTFSKNAGTEVTADILFFRKRLPGEQSNGVSFGSLKQVGTGTYQGKDKKGKEAVLEVPLLVNEYFAEHPEMMLGTVMTAHDAGTGGLYGGDSQTLVPRPGAELSAELADAIGRLPENALAGGTVDAASTASGKESTTLKDGTLTVKDGKVYVADKEELNEVAKGNFKHEGKSRSYADAVKDYLELKDTLKELIKAEQSQPEDPTELRQKLNGQYDRFVEKYGRLNNNKALDAVLEEDVEHYLPQALEKVTTTVNPATGRRTKTVSKGDGILVKRVSQPMTEPATAESLNDAIGISQAYRGRMDVDYIASMLGMGADEARERILAERQAYEDPVTGDLIDRDAYLSGNIREKLETARAAAENDSRYEQNVSDLEAAMPESIPFVDISYKMGTPWIPTDVYESFGEEVVGIKNMRINYIPAVDEFVVSGGYINDYQKSGDFTTTRRDAMSLFEDAINLRKPTITKKVNIGGEERLVKDEAATQEAISAIMDMNDAFIRYIQEKNDIHTRLQNIYNDRYNNYRLREYREPNFKGADGKVHYPGANSAITLRGHQVKAVQRSLLGSTLLAHQVGTGKTFTMITTAMEMRRLGLAKKPMIVVQNATLQDFAADFIKLYPGANILVPNEKERSASQRKRLFNLIATGDFDAIIIPQSFLAFIPDDEGRKKALIQARVNEIMSAAAALEGTDSNLARRLRKEAENLQLSLSEEEGGKGKKKSVKKEAKKEESALVRETRKLDRRTDDVLTFEQMGVDALFIDEAHNFKKIGFTTKMQNVKGVDTGFSERANSLYLKATYVQEKNGGRNVILATGTPITNTMAEVWTMMRFVAPEILEDYQIRTFDEFAATFGQVEPSLEQNSTGGFKVADRFKSYVNVPELVKAFRSHADVVLTTDVEEFKESKNIPKLKDDKMTNHVIQKSDKLQEVMDVLIDALAKDEKKTGKDKTPGLPLVVFSKAKQAAIDLRLINPEYPDDPNSKTNKVVSEVMRIYKESTPDKGIQMIFCDSYQSPASEPAIDLFEYDGSVPQFNLYRDIKQKLIDAGIPKEEIVIVSEISNADRKKAVFEKARNGDVRVLIGGTEKMGVGVNVQDRMIALHHMDAPIRPMDFEQRNGRILRQGNMFAAMDKPVEVLTYGVEGTLDATAYERLRIKQDFINQMMKGDVSGRVMEESDDEDPSGKTFSQMAAELSGDKTLQMLFVAESKMKRLEGLRRSHELKRENAKQDAAYIRMNISALKKSLKEAEALGEKVAKQFPEGITKLTINGRPVKEKLGKALADMLADYEERYALNRSVVFPRVELNDKAGLIVFGHDNGQLVYTLYVDKSMLAEAKPINAFAGVWLSVNNALSNTGKRVAEIKQSIANQEAKLKGAEAMTEKSFDKMDELVEARKNVKALKEELAKKAEKPVPSSEEVKLALKDLKNGGKSVSLPEEMAGDSEESLDRMETAMKPQEEVAVNAPEMVVAMGASDILKAMPNVSTMQFASIVKEANRPEVMAMYVPWTRQVIMLPKHGTVKEMRDKRWHENFHFGIDMVLPQGDEGRLMLERAASEADKLAPALSKWVEDTYGNRNVAEEKVVHVLEEVVSYMEDAGRVKALRGGLDFGSQFPVLNDVANRIINYLTNNGNGKESDDYSGFDEGNQPTSRREDQVRENGEDFAGVRGSATTKAERIEKLRNSRPIVAEWKDYEGRYELNKDSAEKYILDNLRGDYTNKDTGEKIKISRKSVKVMHHDVEDEVHLKSVALIPEMLEESIFIEEVKNEKDSGKFDSYRYYVVGLKLDGVDYTAKLVVGVKGGDVYYDHALTEIEKSDILNQIDLVNAQVYDDNTALSDIKDKRLISILQTNPQENEENLKFGLRGKPRRKAGESVITYHRRVKEWEREMEEAKKRRDVENMDVENPLDTELNDLVMEVMNHPSPIRKRGENDEDFNARQAEWSDWYNNRRPEVERRIAEIKVLLTDEKHAARVKEMKRVDEHLYDGTIPDQKDDEGQLSDEEMREVREIFQEKMQDAKIAVDRDQMKRDIKQEIIERRRKIETSNLEDTFFVEEVKKAAGYNKDILKAIPDYIEGTYTGEKTPELVKAANMVSDWFEEVYNIMAREGVLYDAKKIQNYVTHIWDWNASSEEAQKAYREAIRLRSPFTRHRVIPTYKMGIAMGMVPKYDDITGIILEYGHRATETIENKRLLNFLRGFKVYVPASKDNMPMYVDLIVEDKVKDPLYKKVSNEAFDGYKIVGSYIKYISPVFGRQRIFDHSEEENNPIDKFSNFFWGTSALLKKVQLSFSFFHHGALTETAIAMMGPVKAGKVIGKDVVWDSILKGGTKTLGRVLKRGKFTKTLAKNLMWDIIQKGELPAINDKEAARDAVSHLVSIGATNDYIAADAHAITTKLKKLIKQTEKEVSEEIDTPVNMAFLKNVSEFVDKLNKGSDKLLWDTLHDGFKIASFSYLAKEVRRQAEREGWDEIILERALDECGHLVNDTFGGLHFDLLGQSPVFVRVLRAILLSPDWNLASLRQAVSPFGLGRLYGDKAFWEGVGGENAIKTRKKYGRSFWWTAIWFFGALITGLNVWLRLKDEDEQKEEAEEKRKVDPGYKSPYEIVYPEGMKWYDYTMKGNALGHRTHLFGGRYADGTEIYIRWGKQFRELPELFFGRDGLSFPGPIIDKLAGKVNPLVDLSIGLMSGHSLSGWAHKAMENKIGIEREAGRLYLIAEKLHPFSFNLQPGKEWIPTDIMMPSSKGFSVGKAIREYEKALDAGDFEYLQTVYDACVMNKLNPDRPLEVAGARLEAESKANMIEGIESVQDAVRRFEASDNIKERKRLLRYIEQQIGAQDFNAISQEEMLLKAKDVISGEDAGVEASDIYVGLAEEEDIMQDIRMRKNAAGLKKYYQDYTELMTSQPEAGRRMLEEKRKFIEGYALTTKTRTAINRVKKAMKDGRIDAEAGMQEIRRLRSEYFKRMDEME